MAAVLAFTPGFLAGCCKSMTSDEPSAATAADTGRGPQRRFPAEPKLSSPEPLKRDVPEEMRPTGARALVAEARQLTGVGEARDRYDVSGKGLTVAVIDTGLRSSHVDFGRGERVPTEVNLVDRSKETASDATGHGTHVAGVIAANGKHQGIAPEAQIVPVKVFGSHGDTIGIPKLAEALKWVVDNHEEYNISAVNLSMSFPLNVLSVEHAPANYRPVIEHIRTLTEEKVAVVAAAGNKFCHFKSREGMGFPAIVPECVGVGAVFDADVGSLGSIFGPRAEETGPDVITPFTQRLSCNRAPEHCTDLFAPGSELTSTGSESDEDANTLNGTSQAAPVVTGAILLIQEYYHRKTGELPPVSKMVQWMREGAETIKDGDDEKDNVANTGETYRRLDAPGAFERVESALASQGPSRSLAEAGGKE